MIKRINEIKNIGAFRNFRTGSSIQFEELTFIYGLNTRGKTTLTDIFSSLSDNNPTFIQNRKSIPEIAENQTVKLQFYQIQSEREMPCTYRNGSWDSSEISNHIYVFGTEFIHRNLFTGLLIQRENKENLTQFIIGEEGVELANSIVEDKRNLRRRNRNLPNIVPAYVRGKTDEVIERFLKLEIDELNEEELREELIRKESGLVEEKKRLEEPERILSLPEIEQIVFLEDKTGDLIDVTNNLLNRSYEDISEEALQKINYHIESVFEEKDNAIHWIKEGIDSKNTKSDNCTFCGQSLANAEELIEAYHSYFNEAYREFLENINREINSISNSWKAVGYKKEEDIIKELNKTEKYEGLIENDDYKKLLITLRVQIENLKENDLNDLVKYTTEELEKLFEDKINKPFKTIPSKDFDELISATAIYQKNLKACIHTLKKISEIITEFRKPYLDLSEVENKINDIENNISTLKFKIARIEQNEDCKIYQKELIELTELKDKIENEENRLSTEQSEYLERFFDKIDFYFKKLGSSNFSLEKTTSSRGDQPVYSLLIKFKNTEINESNVGKVLSESDRRALALSVFWAKIDLLEEENKNQAIIVLDDPVTSFDDNRIMLSIDIFKNFLDQVRQIIILTHYPQFIRSFCNRTKNSNITKSFIEIEQDHETSKFSKTSQEQFTTSQYEKVFNKINGFISKEHNEDIRGDLRPFLESLYLPYFYINQLENAKRNQIPCERLSEKINAIFPEGEIRNKFHDFREMLNPDSHIFTKNNEEDIRSFAKQMMDFLYNFEIKN